MLSADIFRSIGFGLKWVVPLLLLILFVHTGLERHVPGWGRYPVPFGDAFDFVEIFVEMMFSKEFWYIAGIYVAGLTLDPSVQMRPQSTEGVRPKVRDWLYFLVSAPLLLVVFHEAVICTLIPWIGIAAGDIGGCTLGWFLLPIFPVAAVWLLLTLFIAMPRLQHVYRLRKDALWLLPAYLACVLIPLSFLLATVLID